MNASLHSTMSTVTMASNNVATASKKGDPRARANHQAGVHRGDALLRTKKQTGALAPSL